MNIAKIKILRLEFPLEDHQTYNDDGYVDSVILHTAQLRLKYGIPVEKIEIPSHWDFSDPLGRYYMHGDDHHIFYLRSSLWMNIFNRAHEETHALQCLGKLDLLEDKLRDEQRRNLDLWGLRNDEVRAYMGSIYALRMRGIPLWVSRINIDFNYNNRDFQEAKDIYKKSKIK